MRAILHMVCVILLLPYLLLAACFLTLDYAVGKGSLPGFFDTLLTLAVLLLSWIGIAIVASFLLLMVLGVSGRTRWFAAAIACLAGIGCVLVLLTMSHSSIGLAQALFLVPCVLALCGVGWLAAKEWPSRIRAPTVASITRP